MNTIKEYICEKLKINKDTKFFTINKDNFNKFIHELLINEYGLKTTNFASMSEDTGGNVYIQYNKLKNHNVDIQNILDDIKLHLPEKSKCKCDYISSSEMYKIIIEYETN